MYKFSIIIACYNSEHKLSVTLESIINQNVSEIQIIIVDGASKDNSMDVFNKYKKYINILISEKDNGISSAWNKGLKHAKGEFVNFLNAGDFYEKDILYDVYLNCKKFDYNFIGYGNTILFEKNIFELKNGKHYSKNIFLINGFGFLHPSVFFPLKLIDKIGYFNEYKKIAIDTDWLIRCQIAKVKFHNINSTVYMEKGGLSSKYKYAAMGEYLDSLIAHKVPKYFLPLFFISRFFGTFKILLNSNTNSNVKY